MVSPFEVTADGAIIGDMDELRRIVPWLQAKYREDAARRSGTGSRLLNDFISACAESVRVREVVGVPFPALTTGGPERIEVSVDEAAVVLGCSPTLVRRRAREGRWPARRIGHQWLIDITRFLED
ncbi:helix-turn-helix domain-containing protein [Curtobacterium sp. MCBD17_035]|uniref:helix-turn-helix domain-containing protein n=1 Tax=Curtobacterium sp. MCBD17_035 TaxID=2175673 RepID=UPI000DA7A014|nr:helix-turn-helix domain-containing protein [Curtobacterium sp. MCBD17_035]WIB68076.1 helix-turn-helix domain-containing protein [Curtobacterium sp. MCBD17_035]